MGLKHNLVYVKLTVKPDLYFGLVVCVGVDSPLRPTHCDRPGEGFDFQW